MTSKEEAALPNVSTDVVLITAIIDDHEGRDLDTVELPYACLHTENYDFVIMKLQGKLVELIAMATPNIYHISKLCLGGQERKTHSLHAAI